MSAPADIILHRLSEIGATVNASGDRLIVRAGATRVPAELVRGVRAARTELLAMLKPSAGQSDAAILELDQAGAAWWRREFRVRTIHRLAVGRTLGEAERLAWGDLQVHWHRLHGKQYPFSQCAGCGEAIGAAPALELADQNRVHFRAIDCLIRYGELWRGDAAQALATLGLAPPEIGAA